jgi:hypothetical protein
LLNITNALATIPDRPLSISSNTLHASTKHARTSSTNTVPGQRNSTAACITAPVNAWKRKNHQWYAAEGQERRMERMTRMCRREAEMQAVKEAEWGLCSGSS